MRIRIAKIEAMAAERPPGYVEAVLDRGAIDGDWLEISGEDLAALREVYRPAESPRPSLAVMAGNAARAARAEVSARLRGVPALDPDAIARRLKICTAPCSHYRPSDRTCSLCGCITAFKARLRSQSCPAGKW